MKQVINKLIEKPCVMSIVANANEGKSMLIYNTINLLKKQYTFQLYVYGLKVNIPDSTEISSIEELEGITNSVIFIDEFTSLLKLNLTKQYEIIENTIRTLYHNNNILVLVGVPENFKKFIGEKTDYVIFKKCTIGELINGSRIGNIIKNYRGVWRGSSLITLPKDKAIFYDGNHYYEIDVPYIQEYDTKRNNPPIFRKTIIEKKKPVKKIIKEKTFSVTNVDI